MDWLNYHHLRYFYIVAREGSLRGAAETLGVSQPSISTQLRQLEDSLGAPLFRRTARKMVLTELGHMVLRYAEEIFSTGRELLSAVRQREMETIVPVFAGIADGVPKLAACEILRPMFGFSSRFRVVCREGKMEELLEQLAAHRLDIVLTDEPAPSTVSFRTFNHPLGTCGVTFCARPEMARRLRKDFPQSLASAPAFLPAEKTALRMTVERWFDALGFRPIVIGEFEDPALMKAIASEFDGFFPLHSVDVEEAVQRLGFKKVGEARGCRLEFHAITAERRIKHPAVVAVTESARARVFG
jgi:LysR family transcriptional regulator, transcriptional activator of nhaA